MLRKFSYNMSISFCILSTPCCNSLFFLHSKDRMNTCLFHFKCRECKKVQPKGTNLIIPGLYPNPLDKSARIRYIHGAIRIHPKHVFLSLISTRSTWNRGVARSNAKGGQPTLQKINNHLLSIRS